MIDFESKLDKKADVSVDVFQGFHTFLKENILNELPEEANIELVYAYTTLTYLQVRYLIRLPKNNSVLSIILLGAKSDPGEDIFTDYLRCDYAILNGDMTKQLTGVKVFGENTDRFKAIFYQIVMPTYEQYRWKS